MFKLYDHIEMSHDYIINGGGYDVKINNITMDKRKYNYIYFDIYKNDESYIVKYNAYGKKDIELIFMEYFFGMSRDIFNINFKIKPYFITFKIYINPNKINDYNKSPALFYIFKNHYKVIDMNNVIDIEKLSFYNNLPNIDTTFDFNNLYNYQKKNITKMLSIENSNYLEINNNIDVDFFGINYNYNLDDNIRIKTNGGILADEMGLGKTISMLGLINCNQSTLNIEMHNNRLYSKATLIIVPSHLAKQWVNEIKKFLPEFKIITVYTKRDHYNITYKDIIDSDIIIMSQQFVMNFNYYIRHNYKYVNPSGYNPYDRNDKLKQMLDNWILNGIDIMNKYQPLFEHFYFHRCVVDEAHEIFQRNMSNNSLNNFILDWLDKNIKSEYKWYVSGTPYTDKIGLGNCLNFINFSINGYDFSGINDGGLFLPYNLQFINNNKYIIQAILEKIMIRSKKEDVDNEINIPGYEEEIKFIELTNVEKSFYESYKYGDPILLQQICCHPLIADKFKNMIGGDFKDINEMQDKLLLFNKENIEKYTAKLEKLNPQAQEYNMLKKKYNEILTESKFIVRALEKMMGDNIKEEECSICYDTINKPVMTDCGHLFCNDCLEMSLGYKLECPQCRKPLDKNKVYTITKKKDIPKNDPLIVKYGTKLATLINTMKTLMKDKKNKIIIFSQWDDMLSLIGKTLSENGITNTFIKGNVYQRNNAISKFKTGKTSQGKDCESNVIMLSLENSASGTNLTEASHIIFIEPINKSKKDVIAIEGQAIGRVCRIGKNEKVKIIRIITKGTIEEDIYNTNIS